MNAKRPNRLADMIQARGDVGTSGHRDVPTSPPPEAVELVKLTVSMPPEVADALRRWALEERTTVAALVEALAAAAIGDPELRHRGHELRRRA